MTGVSLDLRTLTFKVLYGYLHVDEVRFRKLPNHRWQSLFWQFSFSSL